MTELIKGNGRRMHCCVVGESIPAAGKNEMLTLSTSICSGVWVLGVVMLWRPRMVWARQEDDKL